MISIIIPTYNEEEAIGNCLNSLRKQTFKDFEVVVVDDGSTDHTVKVVSRFKEVLVMNGEHKGPGFSRNLGARNAKGNIFIFVDADMTFDEDYLKNLVSPINGDVIGTTHELELVKNTKNIWSRCWGKLRVSKEESGKVKIFRAIRRDKFLELGGFDPKYGYADDQTLWFKYKIKPISAKDTVCYHKNPETLEGVFKQSKWIGASIENRLLEGSLGYISLFIMIILFPLTIPILSIRKCQKNKDFRVFPWMLFFMAARYFGTIKGLFSKIHMKINFK